MLIRLRIEANTETNGAQLRRAIDVIKHTNLSWELDNILVDEECTRAEATEVIWKTVIF